jgi:hypothetical protein
MSSLDLDCRVRRTCLEACPSGWTVSRSVYCFPLRISDKPFADRIDGFARNPDHVVVDAPDSIESNAWRIFGPVKNPNQRIRPLFSQTLTSLTFAMLLAGAASTQSFAESTTCKLTNTAENVVLFEEPCTVTQSATGANTIFEVRMPGETKS